MTYTVRDVVCDYGVYEIYLDKDGEQHEDLKLICNSRSNALLVAEIMRTDLRNEHKRTLDADELLKRISEKAKTPSLSESTINGLCGATAIIYDMLIESEG